MSYIIPGANFSNLTASQALVLDASKFATGLAYSAASSASSLAQRDANSNLVTNNMLETAVSTATAAGTTTLTVASAKWQIFTGSTTQTVVLPVASTLAVGQSWNFINKSTGVITIQSSGANTITTLTTNNTSTLTCILASGTGTASWSFTNTGSSSGITSINGDTTPAQTLAVANAGTDFAVGTSAGTTTFNLPSASASALRGLVTNAPQTLSGAKTFDSTVTVSAASNQIVLGSGTPLTLTSAQSTARTLTIPNITTADTAIVSNLTQIMQNKTIFNTINAISLTTGTISQSANTATGTAGVFTIAMIGGVIIYGSGEHAIISTFIDSNNLFVQPSQTVASTTYTLYYGALVGVWNPYDAGVSYYTGMLGNLAGFAHSADRTKRVYINPQSNTTGVSLNIRSNQSTTRTLNIPDITLTDQFTTDNFATTLFNKNLSDSTTYIIDVADATKRIGFDVTGSTGTTLNVTSNQSTSQTLNLPNITQTDTAIVSFLPQTEYKKVMIGGQDAVPPNLNQTTLSLSPGASYGSVVTYDNRNLLYCLTATNQLGNYNLKTGVSTTVGVGTTPFGMCLYYASNYAYVANNGSSNVTVVNFTGMTVVTTIALGAASPRDPCITFDEQYVYVPIQGSSGGLNNIKIIATATNTIFATINDANLNGASSAAVARNGTEVYFCGNVSGIVSYYTIPNTVGGTITCPCAYIIADAYRDLMYVCSGTNIRVISTVSHTVTFTVAVPGSTTITSLSASTDGKYLYATDATSTQYYVLDLTTSPPTYLTTTTGTPTGTRFCAISPDNKSLYINGTGAPSINAYEVTKTQYIAYAVGKASQSADTIQGSAGAKWPLDMTGATIIFANGTVSSMDSFGDFDTFYSNIAKTIGNQTYTLYYGNTTTSPTGRGFLGSNSVLIYPRFTGYKTFSRYAQIDVEQATVPAGSVAVLNFTDNGSSIGSLNIPNAGTDALVTNNYQATLTNKNLVDASTNIIDDVDNTKWLRFQLAGSSANTLLTVATSQTSTRTITIPDVSSGEQFVTLNVVQTLTNKTVGLTDALWTTPAAPFAGNVRLFGQTIGTNAGRCMTTQVDSTTQSYEFQPFFATKKISMATATGYTGATTLSTYGMTLIGAAGTISTPAITSINPAVSARRLTIATTPVAVNTSAYFAQAVSPQANILAAATQSGGFHFVCKFTFSESTPIISNRLFIGLSNAVPSNSLDPMNSSAGFHMAGLAVNANGGFLNFYTRNTGTGATSGTVTNAAWPPIANRVYTFSMYQPPSTGTAYMGLYQWTGSSGTSIKFQAAVSTNYPSAFTFPIIWLNTGPTDTAASRGISIISLYIETEN